MTLFYPVSEWICRVHYVPTGCEHNVRDRGAGRIPAASGEAAPAAAAPAVGVAPGPHLRSQVHLRRARSHHEPRLLGTGPVRTAQPQGTISKCLASQSEALFVIKNQALLLVLSRPIWSPVCTLLETSLLRPSSGIVLRRDFRFFNRKKTRSSCT